MEPCGKCKRTAVNEPQIPLEKEDGSPEETLLREHPESSEGCGEDTENGETIR